jgi:hypothetical protein
MVMTHAVLYTPDDIAAHHDSNPMVPISRPQVDKGVISSWMMMT